MEVLKSGVYLLCFAASSLCMILLARAWRSSRNRLLLWSALCFVFLALNNLLLFVDLSVFPVEIDLRPLRLLTAVAAIGVLLYGFIMETD
ncbi:DUF5985 family protein [Roseiterribacter gracilis]|uniref:Uncharacterized protein n=1 Tax=Roseiterribacter gracilis TaxID=2812848 RepID=A0A8S8XEL3_9PROT|nr:hypothetical protein TMPK1_33010 [Rhodospirillales bacterium TMPK1]